MPRLPETDDATGAPDLRPATVEHANPSATTPAAPAESFEGVYSQYFPFVWRCLRGLGVPDAALDDATQDVFLVVHRQRAGFQGTSTLRTWLFGIIRNVASNHRRASKRRQIRQDAFGQEFAHLQATAAPGPLERAQNAQAAAFLRDFLDKLNERKRAVFMLAAIEEMSVPEVAEALSIPLNTVYTLLRRARADFDRAMARLREAK